MATVQNQENHEKIDDIVKPPFLRRVRIRGYKSIRFCDVTLEPLTIFVGRNGSGKSNFLDALALLSDVMDVNLAHAIRKRNGWHSIHCRSMPEAKLEIDLSARVPSYKSVWHAEYSLALMLGNHSIENRREVLQLAEIESDRKCGFIFENGNVEWLGKEFFKEDSDGISKSTLDGLTLQHPRLSSRADPGNLLLGVIGTQPYCDVSEMLRASRVYNFSPEKMRLHQPIAGMPFLTANGENLARAIVGLDEIEPESIHRIGKYLNALVPAVKTFRRVQYGDFETVQFEMANHTINSRLKFDASSMSDGTLRILASLLAAYQIVLPNGYPGCIAIEEVETSLHPAAMRALADALNEATSQTQILLSTHSTELLDNPTIKPENIRVVEMIDGETVIGPVDEASVEIVRRNLDTLGGLERQNQLSPDSDDLERQRQLAEQNMEPAQ